NIGCKYAFGCKYDLTDRQGCFTFISGSVTARQPPILGGDSVSQGPGSQEIKSKTNSAESCYMKVAHGVPSTTRRAFNTREWRSQLRKEIASEKKDDAVDHCSRSGDALGEHPPRAARYRRGLARNPESGRDGQSSDCPAHH